MNNVLETLIKICNKNNLCPFDYGLQMDTNVPCPVCGDLGVVNDDSENIECVAANV